MGINVAKGAQDLHADSWNTPEVQKALRKGSHKKTIMISRWQTVYQYNSNPKPSSHFFFSWNRKADRNSRRLWRGIKRLNHFEKKDKVGGVTCLNFKGSYKPIGIQTAWRRLESRHRPMERNQNSKHKPSQEGQDHLTWKQCFFQQIYEANWSPKNKYGDPYFTPYAKINPR